jgi:hypothetical protein
MYLQILAPPMGGSIDLSSSSYTAYGDVSNTVSSMKYAIDDGDLVVISSIVDHPTDPNLKRWSFDLTTSNVPTTGWHYMVVYAWDDGGGAATSPAWPFQRTN